MSILSYNEYLIEQRDIDGYVNLTQMAKVNQIELDELERFMKSKYAKKCLRAIRRTASKPVIVETMPVTFETGGFPVTLLFQTTWSHPLVAIEFSEWISPEFYAWCHTNIKISAIWLNWRRINIQTPSPRAK
ncbi:MAG: KilA-N domain-containing protein [bacterium]|jgi:hypothetical protein